MLSDLDVISLIKGIDLVIGNFLAIFRILRLIFDIRTGSTRTIPETRSGLFAATCITEAPPIEWPLRTIGSPFDSTKFSTDWIKSSR